MPFVDFIEQRLKSDPAARKILAMDETATRALDPQALEQILIGHDGKASGHRWNEHRRCANKPAQGNALSLPCASFFCGWMARG